MSLNSGLNLKKFKEMVIDDYKVISSVSLVSVFLQEGGVTIETSCTAVEV